MGKQVKLFKDIETGDIITTEQLFGEYEESMQEDDRGLTFGEYVFNCMTAQGGTLEAIDTVKR